jgi:hypothetical protein
MLDPSLRLIITYYGRCIRYIRLAHLPNEQVTMIRMITAVGGWGPRINPDHVTMTRARRRGLIDASFDGDSTKGCRNRKFELAILKKSEFGGPQSVFRLRCRHPRTPHCIIPMDIAWGRCCHYFCRCNLACDRFCRGDLVNRCGPPLYPFILFR